MLIEHLNRQVCTAWLVQLFFHRDVRTEPLFCAQLKFSFRRSNLCILISSVAWTAESKWANYWVDQKSMSLQKTGTSARNRCFLRKDFSCQQSLGQIRRNKVRLSRFSLVLVYKGPLKLLALLSFSNFGLRRSNITTPVSEFPNSTYHSIRYFANDFAIFGQFLWYLSRVYYQCRFPRENL